MGKFVKAMYLFLCFRDNHNISEAKNMIEFACRLRDIFSHDEAYDFMSKYVRPGNYLYSEFMKQKAKRIKGKITLSQDSIIFY